MKACKECGSYAINHHLHGRDGSDGDLCDVCYWHKRAAQQGRDALEALPPASPVALTDGELKVFKLGWLECEAAHRAAIAAQKGQT